MYQITKHETFADSTVTSTKVLAVEFPTEEGALNYASDLVDNFQPFHPSYPKRVSMLIKEVGWKVTSKYGQSIKYTIEEK